MFHILKLAPDTRCHASDSNLELISTYAAIRDNVDAVITSLKVHAEGYSRDPEAYYYDVRKTVPDDSVQRAARMIFLNKTGFNGLYRVNSRNLFNVPFGRYKNPLIADVENLRAVSHMLHSCDIEIKCCDYMSVMDVIREGDFVYFDPPYMPVSRTANFTTYTPNPFGDDNLKSLVKLCLDLADKGAKVMFSNADSKMIADMFPGSWKKHRVAATRAINSVAGRRMGHFELLVTSY